MSNSTCVLITGIPYSGKSVPAGVLHHMGVYLGNFHLHPDPIYNRHDYFEHPKFVDVHGDITKTRSLTGMYRAVNKIFDKNQVFLYDEVGKNTLNIIFDQIVYSLAETGVWGLKDPRLCLPDIADGFCDVASKYSDIKLIVCTRSEKAIIDTTLKDMCGSKMDVTEVDVVKYVRRWNVLMNDFYYNFDGEKMMVDFWDAIYHHGTYLQELSDFVALPVTNNARLFLEKRNDSIVQKGV